MVITTSLLASAVALSVALGAGGSSASGGSDYVKVDFGQPDARVAALSPTTDGEAAWRICRIDDEEWNIVVGIEGNSSWRPQYAGQKVTPEMKLQVACFAHWQRLLGHVGEIFVWDPR